MAAVFRLAVWAVDLFLTLVTCDNGRVLIDRHRKAVWKKPTPSLKETKKPKSFELKDIQDKIIWLMHADVAERLVNILTHWISCRALFPHQGTVFAIPIVATSGLGPALRTKAPYVFGFVKPVARGYCRSALWIWTLHYLCWHSDWSIRRLVVLNETTTVVFVATALVAVTAVMNKWINGQLVVDIAAAVDAIAHDDVVIRATAVLLLRMLVLSCAFWTLLTCVCVVLLLLLMLICSCCWCYCRWCHRREFYCCCNRVLVVAFVVVTAVVGNFGGSVAAFVVSDGIRVFVLAVVISVFYELLLMLIWLFFCCFCC